MRTYRDGDGLTLFPQKPRRKPLEEMGISSNQVTSETIQRSREVPPQPVAGHIPQRDLEKRMENPKLN
jgi:hypothetical protein